MRGAAPMRPVGRLTKRNDFVAAASGRRFHTGRMTVQGRLRGEGEGLGCRGSDRDGASRVDTGCDGAVEGLRVGLTVTKRVGNAVARNRIKRRLRQAVREAIARSAGTDAAGAGADIVVLARRDAIDADFASLIEDIARALHVVTKPGRSATRPPGPRHGRGGKRVLAASNRVDTALEPRDAPSDSSND